MTSLDKLARDLAWIEHKRLCPGGRTGANRIHFWRTLTEDAREGWRGMARRFCFFLHRLSDDALNDAHMLGDFGTGT